MDKLATIFGGSGFVGRYIARRMAQQGWRVRVAVRRPNEAGFVRTYGAVGQVEPVFCNIRDDASVRAVTHGAQAVVNCVGILVEEGKNKFFALQQEGAGRIARIAAEEGVERMVHVSAIGADAGVRSLYAKSKALGEQAVLEAFPSAVILRPSVIFGPEDQFFNRFATMAKFTAALPLVGATSKFQPVYVDDVAQAAVMGVTGAAAPGIYELGGPEVATFRQLMRKMLGIIQRKRILVRISCIAAKVLGALLDGVQVLTAGLLTNRILTRDQVRNLAKDNVVSEGAKGFADLGIEPTTMEAVLPEYLYRYRPSGQYCAIKASARNLKA